MSNNIADGTMERPTFFNVPYDLSDQFRYVVRVNINIKMLLTDINKLCSFIRAHKHINTSYRNSYLYNVQLSNNVAYKILARTMMYLMTNWLIVLRTRINEHCKHINRNTT